MRIDLRVCLRNSTGNFLLLVVLVLVPEKKTDIQSHDKGDGRLALRDLSYGSA